MAFVLVGGPRGARSEEIAAGIDGAKLEIVPDAGHSSTIEQPEVLTRLIREHLAG